MSTNSQWKTFQQSTTSNQDVFNIQAKSTLRNGNNKLFTDRFIDDPSSSFRLHSQVLNLSIRQKNFQISTLDSVATVFRWVRSVQTAFI